MRNMVGKFPKRRSTDKIAEIGVNAVSRVINDEFGWIFRRTHEEHDFGVDGYVDFVTNEGGVTGKFIALQIKTGKSYLSSKGENYWYRDSKEHLNYFLNLPVPLLLILYDPDSRTCYWATLEANKVELTTDSWRHPLKKTQKIYKLAKSNIEMMFGLSQDHVSMFEQDLAFSELISNNSVIQ